MLGRYDGEEFVVVLPQTLDEARVGAEAIRQAVAATTFQIDASSPAAARGAVLHRQTVSIGLAGTTDGADSLADLLAVADACLYRSKRAGRNRVTTSSD